MTTGPVIISIKRHIQSHRNKLLAGLNYKKPSGMLSREAVGRKPAALEFKKPTSTTVLLF